VYVDRRARAATPATVRYELMVVSALLARARRWSLCGTNPVALVDLPPVENVIVRYVTADEQQRLLAAAKEPLRTAILVAVHSGLREGEQRRLTWDDFRLDEGVVIVRHTKSRRDRAVPMNATLKTAFAAIRRTPNCPYVFANPKTGQPMSRFNNTAWRSLLRRCGVRNLRWHDLRHSFASSLAQAGTPMLVIKELLGHSSLQVTGRYAHLSPDNLREAVQRLDTRPADAANSGRRRATAQGTQATLPGLA
jgi:integrase